MVSPKMLKAQGIDLDLFLEARIEDTNELLAAYLQPPFEGFGFGGLNSGWCNTAKPHNLLGFDMKATVLMT